MKKTQHCNIATLHCIVTRSAFMTNSLCSTLYFTPVRKFVRRTTSVRPWQIPCLPKTRWRTSLLCIVGEIADRGGSVAVTVAVGDSWKVTVDKGHKTDVFFHFFWLNFFPVFFLYWCYSTQIEKFGVSCMRDSFYQFYFTILLIL